jgi:hypothetical protein
MFKGGVGREDRVVRLNDRAGQLGSWVYAELKLGLLAIVSGQMLQQKGTETRASSSTKRVEDEETLQAGAVVSQAAELLHHGIDKLFSDGIVTTGI